MLENFKTQDEKQLGSLKLVKKLEAPGEKRIPTSSIIFNTLIDGGVPDSGLIEFWGGSGAGKTLLALNVVKNMLETDDPRHVLWVDVENSFDWRWARVCGIPFVNQDNSEEAENSNKESSFCESFWQTRPEPGISGEDILSGILSAAASNSFKLIVVDSIAAIVPGTVMKKDIGERTMAPLPILLADFLPRINPYLIQNRILLIIINQQRDVLGSYGVGGKHSPGGNTLKHFRLLSVQFKRGPYYKSDYSEIIATADRNKAVGFFTQVVVERNKTSDNGGVLLGQLAFSLSSGVDVNAEMLSYLRCFDIIKGAGNKYFKGVTDENGELIPFRSKAAVEAFVISHPEYFELICRGPIKDKD